MHRAARWVRLRRALVTLRETLWLALDALRAFFFSSRRRHTRCSRDWSSDVCSSDLGGEHGSRLHIEHGDVTRLRIRGEQILRRGRDRHGARRLSGKKRLGDFRLIRVIYGHRVHSLTGDENLAAIGIYTEVLGLDGKRQAHQFCASLYVENRQRARAAITDENLTAI